MKQITILGATGSIGQSALDIVARHRESYRIHALTANRNLEGMLQLCRSFEPRYAVMSDAECALSLIHI